ncbi:hypothetical protein C8R44DRAFT_754635 [Mycena epipterygia]|nr:hypothetical protein C8R44DRAFT_754635 [Mycena epipterygia]
MTKIYPLAEAQRADLAQRITAIYSTVFTVPAVSVHVRFTNYAATEHYMGGKKRMGTLNLVMYARKTRCICGTNMALVGSTVASLKKSSLKKSQLSTRSTAAPLKVSSSRMGHLHPNTLLRLHKGSANANTVNPNRKGLTREVLGYRQGSLSEDKDCKNGGREQLREHCVVGLGRFTQGTVCGGVDFYRPFRCVPAVLTTREGMAECSAKTNVKTPPLDGASGFEKLPIAVIRDESEEGKEEGGGRRRVRYKGMNPGGSGVRK